MVESRDPRVFSHGACHIFAYALRLRFGYATYGVKKTTKSYSHVYCLGQQFAVDVSGRKSEDDMLANWQQYEGFYSRADSVRLREPVDCERLFQSDYAVTGLLSEKKFIDAASLFADEIVASNLAMYEKA